MTIQADAFKKRLGAALLQDDGQVAFVSKVLTPVEQHYANNKHEWLACVLGAEIFYTYIFGRNFTLECDHESLEQISLKNLANASACLQCMLLCLQDYDFTIRYTPVTEMALADTISRYSPRDAPEIKLEVSVNHIHINTQKKLDYQADVGDDLLLHPLADTHLWMA